MSQNGKAAYWLAEWHVKLEVESHPHDLWETVMGRD
jgi:hypothetical protein